MRLKVRRGPGSFFSTMELPPSARIHIMGVCGTAMSALAGLLVKSGYQVSGSDKSFYPPASEELKNLGITLLKGYKKKHIHKTLDLVVVGNVITKKMPEAQALLKSHLPYVSLPEILSPLFMAQKNSIMVCGTHGKTTLSFLSAHLLKSGGKSPGFLIGGVSKNFKAGFCLKKSASFFVVEGDEYDTAFFQKSPKFLHYPWGVTLLTGVEFDHADIYKNIKEVQKVFLTLVRKKQPALPLKFRKKTFHGFIMALSSPFMKILAGEAKKAGHKVITYGKSEGDWQWIKRTKTEGPACGQILTVQNPTGRKTPVQTPLLGEHNAWNVLGAYVLSRVLKLNLKSTLSALRDFKGVKRRFQIRGRWGGVTVVEDFAHHPTAVRAVLKTAREHYPSYRLLVGFEPRSATSRTNIFHRQYVKALSLADLVFCLKATNQSRIAKDKRLNTKKLVKDINTYKSKGPKAFYARDAESMASQIQKHSRKGDLLILMSNGDFQNIYSLLPQKLKSVKRV